MPDDEQARNLILEIKATCTMEKGLMHQHQSVQLKLKKSIQDYNVRMKTVKDTSRNAILEQVHRLKTIQGTISAIKTQIAAVETKNNVSLEKYKNSLNESIRVNKEHLNVSINKLTVERTDIASLKNKLAELDGEMKILQTKNVEEPKNKNKSAAQIHSKFVELQEYGLKLNQEMENHAISKEMVRLSVK